MKHKLMSTLLAGTMLFSLGTTAFAASDEAKQAADTLYQMNLFSGTGTDKNGKPIYDLDRIPTREEAVTLLIRLLGKVDEAKEMNCAMPFTDVSDWAKPYVAYAYEKGLTAGTSDTTFGGNDSVTTSQYLSFVLRALGYTSGTDFQWDKAWELTDKIGVTDGQYTTNSKSFLRGDVVIVSNNALATQVKNGQATLAETLGLKTTKKLPPQVCEMNKIYLNVLNAVADMFDSHADGMLLIEDGANEGAVYGTNSTVVSYAKKAQQKFLYAQACAEKAIDLCGSYPDTQSMKTAIRNYSNTLYSGVLTYQITEKNVKDFMQKVVEQSDAAEKYLDEIFRIVDKWAT